MIMGIEGASTEDAAPVVLEFESSTILDSQIFYFLLNTEEPLTGFFIIFMNYSYDCISVSEVC
jgi:hypothetical protein